MGTHPYLNFADTTYSSITGKKCTGRSDSSVNIISIPSKFDEVNVIELGPSSFSRTNIISVFIPKTVLYINKEAFRYCNNLKEVRFEKGSCLERINIVAFAQSPLIEKLDLPPSTKTIDASSSYTQFYEVKSKCISYLGSSNFESGYFFNKQPEIIHVSKSYPGTKFGDKEVTRDGKTCLTDKGRFVATINQERYNKLWLLLLVYILICTKS